MKYFKILKISYQDSLETIYCREISTEEIEIEDGKTKTFTKYLKIGYLYGDKVLEEENECLENKTIRESNAEEWKKAILKKLEKTDLENEKYKKDIEKNEKYKAELEAELASLEKAEA